MKQVHLDYWEAFNRLGKETLSQHGFSFEVMTSTPPRMPELFQIRLIKGMQQYILSFSSHHLDYQDGVTVTEGGQLVLPRPELKNTGIAVYGYSDKSIQRLIDDICSLK